MSNAVLEETWSESFRSRPPAILDERQAPRLAVVTRVSPNGVLRGKIEYSEQRWLWELFLDTQAVHDGNAGVAESYESAREQLVKRLQQYNVQVEFLHRSVA